MPPRGVPGFGGSASRTPLDVIRPDAGQVPKFAPRPAWRHPSPHRGDGGLVFLPMLYEQPLFRVTRRVATVTVGPDELNALDATGAAELDRATHSIGFGGR